MKKMRRKNFPNHRLHITSKTCNFIHIQISSHSLHIAIFSLVVISNFLYLTMRIRLYPYPNGPWQSIWTKIKFQTYHLKLYYKSSIIALLHATEIYHGTVNMDIRFFI